MHVAVQARRQKARSPGHLFLDMTQRDPPAHDCKASTLPNRQAWFVRLATHKEISGDRLKWTPLLGAGAKLVGVACFKGKEAGDEDAKTAEARGEKRPRFQHTSLGTPHGRSHPSRSSAGPRWRSAKAATRSSASGTTTRASWTPRGRGEFSALVSTRVPKQPRLGQAALNIGGAGTVAGDGRAAAAADVHAAAALLRAGVC